MMNIRKIIPRVFSLSILAVLFSFSAFAQTTLPKEVKFTPEELMDKLKGGWAGQVIGVTFGGPTEFKYNGTFIQDYEVLPWWDGYIKETMEEIPGLFDDIYMDLTFVEVIERLGVDAPADSFAVAFANAPYPLWHANQAARYNILNGIMPPESGHWHNNPHADDLDYQIEADFAGLMSPGLPNAASAISDKIGHIMTYGDGWYGGVYVGAMYSIAYVSDDIEFVVNKALETVPKESDFYQCIADVIQWHKEYPNDWKQTWLEIQKKWAEEVGCPDGVFAPFNIDAKLNAAYIVLGLLYGEEDFTKTMEISTRAGQDSDCNPSNAGGILGTMVGYQNIPAYWKMGLSEAESIDFEYTNMSLNDVYQVSYSHALQMIEKKGGTVGQSEIVIPVEEPVAVRYEKSFDGHFPVRKTSMNKTLQGTDNEHSFNFDGIGVVVTGRAHRKDGIEEDYTFDLTVFVDGQEAENFKMSTESLTRRLELFWKYELPKTKHDVRIVVNNPKEGYYIRVGDALIYSDEKIDGLHYHANKSQ